jgi:uncharacterized protein YciU (UPF0263 family)
MTHQYKRRTSSEAKALAQEKFRAEAETHLTAAELDEFFSCGAVGAGSPTGQWEEIVGAPVSDKRFYEFKLHKPSNDCPYVEKIYALILVSRDRSNDHCFIQWKPAMEPYTGPWFS